MYETWSDMAQRKPHEAQRLRMLVSSSQLVARVITNSIDLGEAASTLLAELCRSIGWEIALLYQAKAFDQRLVIAGTYQDERIPDSALVERSRTLGLLPGEGLTGRAFASGQPIWFSRERSEPWFRRHEEASKDGLRTGVAFPVRAGNKVVGVIEVFTREPKPESRDLLQVLDELASPIASMLAHARSEEVKQLLDQANTALFGSLDYRERLNAIANLCVPRVADFCAIFCLAEDGLADQVAAAHVDANAAESLHELGRRIRLPLVGRLEAVMRERRALLIEQVNLDEFAPLFRDASQREAIRRLDVQSSLLIPLHVRERALGLLVLATMDRRHYSAEAIGVAEELGRRASLAIDNGRLFESERQARGEAEAATQAKDEFLAVLSHELRTPLQSMLGWTQMLRSRRLDDETAARGLAAIERATRSQAQLIGDLLDVSRIVAGKLALDSERVDLARIIDTALETVRASAEAKSIRLERYVDATQADVIGDKYRLQQIVTNLLSNAIKFTGQGGRVVVRLTCADGTAKLVIEDNGIGIRPDFMPFVFDRFRQADSTSRRAHGGLGLGLTIVQHLVNLHGGTVTAFSEGENKGSRFEVALPLASPAEDGEIERAPESVDLRGLPRLDGLRVLVVDDDAETREVIRTLLNACGASVTTVKSAKLALESIAHQPPDLLISDVRMPDEDGYEFIRRVRALENSEGAAVPAIALTADASRSAREHALAAGFQHHLAKPVQPIFLAKVIVASLEGKAAP